MKAAIIGSGIGGLSLALRLKKIGFDVHLFEANSYPGGKLTAFQLGNYRFDAGPSLFTMPYLVDEIFEDMGENPKDHFQYKALEAVCHYFFEDKSNFTAYFDKKKLANEIEQRLNLDPNPVLKHLEKSAFLYEQTAELFMMKSLHQLKNYFHPRVLKALFNVHKLNLTHSMHYYNKTQLKHPKLVQIFDRFATYNGSNPYKAPGVLNIIPHLEHNQGAFFPKGGMHQICLSLYKLGRQRGVNYYFDAAVTKICTKNNICTGVVVNNQTHNFDIVASNMDIVPTYRRLMPNEEAPEKTLSQERSSSALIFYWGIKKSFKELGVHNIFFSGNYKEEFDYIFDKNNVSNDPTIYINITSKEEKADAPENCENWFVMVNVPGDKGQDWQEIIPRTRKNILKKMQFHLGQDIEQLIEVEEVLTPALIAAKTSSFEGSLYGASSNNSMAAFLRHPNFSQTIKNLYFVGGSVHPGGGIPLCLLSSKITAEIIAEKTNAK